MVQLAFDTSCVVNLLSREERPSPGLLALMRLALDGKVRVNVTQLVDVEVPSSEGSVGADVDGEAPSPVNRGFIRLSLDQFPVVEVSSARVEQRDARARDLLKLLWPNVQEGSRKHKHSLLDCQHLASQALCGGEWFITLDQELVRKAALHSDEVGVRVVLPDDAVTQLVPQAAPADAAASWTPIVRKARDDDGGEIKGILAPVAGLYSDFESWIAKALSQKQVWVAYLDGRIGAVAIWAPKEGTDTVKLSTFFVAEDFKGRGLGPHLLFHQLRLWVESRVSKVFVTVSSERLHVISFFLSYGFRIEGASSRRYKSDAVEFVLAKHLFYEVVDDDRLEPFISEVSRQVFDLPGHERVQDPKSWFLAPHAGRLQVHRTDGVPSGVGIATPSGQQDRRFSLHRFEELIYPARFAITGRRAYLIPIQPHWADGMLHVPRAQGSLFAPSDKLALRSDNAYYCYPTYYDDDVEGCPVLFYVSRTDKFVAGFGRIVERDISEPEDLLLKYDRLGIYGIDNIRQHVRASGRYEGCAMAIRFAWWVPFVAPIPLQQLQDEFGLNAPQTISAIDYGKYERIIAAGGIDW